MKFVKKLLNNLEKKVINQNQVPYALRAMLRVVLQAKKKYASRRSAADFGSNVDPREENFEVEAADLPLLTRFVAGCWLN